MPFVETLNEDHQKVSAATVAVGFGPSRHGLPDAKRCCEQLLTGSSQYGGGRSARDLAEPREHTGWGLGVNAPPS